MERTRLTLKSSETDQPSIAGNEITGNETIGNEIAERETIGANRKTESLRLPMIGLLFFFVLVFLIPLGNRPMICPDESRYAEVPREMLDSGNWLVPCLCGVPYFEKPALGYQTTALSFRLFGENLFALRLPNALAVAVTALFLCFFLIRTIRDSRASLLSTIFYLTSSFIVAIGMFAVPDSQLTAALAVSLGCFYLARESLRKRDALFWLILSGIACGLAFQIKGFLAFAVPVLVLTPFLIWMKDWRRLFLYPWIPIGVAILVSLPWALAIHQREPDFWRYFFIEEHLNRFLSGTHDKGSESIFYFVPLLLIGLLPAGGTLICAWSGWRSKGFWTQPVHRFLLCWLVLPFLFFSISSCKTGTYILPCFPAATALLALGVLEAFRIDPEKAKKRMSLFFFWLGAGSLLGGVLTMILFPLPWHEWFPNVYPLYPEGHLTGYLSTSLSIFWGAALIKTRKNTTKAFHVYFWGLAPVLLAIFFVLPIGLAKTKAAAYGLEKGLEQVPVQANDIIFVEGQRSTAFVWTLKRTDLIYLNPPKEVGFWFEKNKECCPVEFYQEQDRKKIQKILEKAPDKKGILITSRDLKKDPLLFPRPVEKYHTFQGITILRF